MKKTIALSLVIFSLMFTQVVYAQTSFILGLATGALLSSNGKKTEGSSPSVIYTSSSISRISNPYLIRQACYVGDNFRGHEQYKENSGMTWWGMFVSAIGDGGGQKEARQFEILQIMRIVGAAGSGKATFWFSYIEKDKLSPIMPNK